MVGKAKTLKAKCFWGWRGEMEWNRGVLETGRHQGGGVDYIGKRGKS